MDIKTQKQEAIVDWYVEHYSKNLIPSDLKISAKEEFRRFLDFWLENWQLDLEKSIYLWNEKK